MYVFATVGVVMGLGFVYWLVVASGDRQSLLRNE